MSSNTPPSFLSRIAIAIGSFFAILGNSRLAADVTRLRAGEALAADVAPREIRVEVPVEKIVEVKLSDEARGNLQVSVDAVKELLVACKGIDESLA